MNGTVATGKEKLVVEVIAAHNLMPKDGEGSSSPFMAVGFENQRHRTQVKRKDLNPIWNEKLVFHIKDVADLPYRVVEVHVFHERRSNKSKNFLEKLRVSGSSIVKEVEEGPQMYTLDKRSLFSHIRGEITLKLYVSTRGELKQVGIDNNGVMGSVSASVSTSGFSKKKKMRQQNPALVVQEQLVQENKPTLQGQNHAKLEERKPGELKPVVITTGPGPAVPVSSVGVGADAGLSLFSSKSNEFSQKETSPYLGGGPLNKDKTSSTYDLVEQM